MGSVVYRSRFSDRNIALLLVFAMYFIGAAIFMFFGLQPAVNSSDVYASEAATADGSLDIEAIGLHSPATTVRLGSDANLEVPDQIVGTYSVHPNKTLLIGHSSTAFSNLPFLKTGQEISFNNKTYLVTQVETKEKSNISMKSILKAEDIDTIVLMTCAGEHISGNDYSHRLIITATLKK